MMWRGRLLAWIAPLLLLAQFALAVHQLEHRITPDALSPAHECVLCNVATGAAPPPTPFVILPPDLGPDLPPVVAADEACCTLVASPFRSRAPPLSAAA
jgi:hypothetical protein